MTYRYRHGERPLEGYTIQRGIGRGGFGEVYYAISDGGREVALKTIFQNAEIELRGVRQCINLKSPHLVSIFDVRVNDEGIPFVIMEYIAGPSLRDILREHPHGLGPQKTAFLAREIGRGLACLHEHGIVHRDLKPENIFYEDGYVKIGDYGLSKFISVSRQSGQTISVGTVHYMAPEIGSGIYNQSIDIYAFGVVIYELLRGAPPFEGASFGEILMKHLTQPPDLEGIEEPFRRVISRALEKKPEDRYPNVEALVADLLEDSNLRESLSLFNPKTLSTAAGRAAPALRESPAVSPQAETSNLGPGPERRGPPPSPPAAEQPETLKPAALQAQTQAQVLTPPPQPKAEPAAAAAPAPVPPPAGGRRRPIPQEALDPLDRKLRLVRAAFLGGTVAVAWALFRDAAQLVAMLLFTFPAAAAVAAAERQIARAFQIAPGFPRRFAAAVLAAVPVLLGSALLRPERFGRGLGPPDVHTGTPLAFLLGLLLTHWHLRLDPLRAERISIRQACNPALLGFVLGLLFQGQALFTAAALGAVSLIVNAYSPYVPPERRRPASRPARHHGGGRARKKPQPPAAEVEEIPWLEPAEPTARAAAEPAPVLPSPAARTVWLLAAAVFGAGSAAFLAAAVGVGITSGRLLDGLLFAAPGLGLVPYTVFGVYRGTRAKAPGAWRRTLRPFLLATAASGGAVALVLGWAWLEASRLGRAGPFDDELAAFTGAFLCGAALIGGFVFLADRVFSRAPAPPAAPPGEIPWSERPVPVFLRFVEGALGLAGLTAGFVVAGWGLFLARGSEEWLACLWGAVLSLAFGGFFLRQSLRLRRGTLWSGTVRPFLLAAGGGVFAASALTLASFASAVGGRATDQEIIAVSALGAAALVIFGFAYFLRESDAERKETAVSMRERSPPGPPAPPSERRGLGGVGLLCWLGGSALLLAAVLLEVRGLGAALELPRGLAADIPPALPGAALLLLALGTLALLGSRVRFGFLHFLRGAAGVAALGALGGLLLEIARSLSYRPEVGLTVTGPIDDLRWRVAACVIFLIFAVWVLAVPPRTGEDGRGSGALDGGAGPGLPPPSRPVEA